MFKQVWFILCVVEFALAGITQTGQLKNYIGTGVAYTGALASRGVDTTRQLVPPLPASVAFALVPNYNQFPRYGIPIYYNPDDFYIHTFQSPNNIIVDTSTYPINGLQADPLVVPDTFQYLAPYGSYGGRICFLKYSGWK